MDRFTNQEFLYRQVPVDYSGIARINSIKGNTISFNQLAYISSGSTTFSGRTVTYDGTNKIVFSGTQTADYDGVSLIGTVNNTFKALGDYNIVQGHKYFAKISGDSSIKNCTVKFYISKTNGWGDTIRVLQETIGDGQLFQIPVNAEYTYFVFYLTVLSAVANGTYYINLFDLTLMGIDNLTTTAEVENWLSTHIGNLLYFDYTLGKLISFNGTGLKTTGKNLFDKSTISTLTVGYLNDDGTINGNTGFKISDYIPTFGNTNMAISSDLSAGNSPSVCWYDSSLNYISGEKWANRTQIVLSLPSNAKFIRVSLYDDRNGTGTFINSCQIEYGNAITTYEPYTSNTLSLPTSTYFPFGADKVNNVYDELIPNSDVYKRMGIVDLGNFTWNYNSSYGFYSSEALPKYVPLPDTHDVPNIKCAKYITASQDSVMTSGTKYLISYIRNTGQLLIATDETTSGSTLKSSLQGTFLVYALNTPLHNYGVLDLGDLEWTMYTVDGGNNHLFRSEVISGCKASTDANAVPNILCKNYRTVAQNSRANKTLSMQTSSTNKTFDIIDNSFNDASAFQTAMSGQYILFELSSPVAPSSMEDTYPIWQNGTEQILPENTSTPTTAPIIEDVDYATGIIEVITHPEPTQGGTTTGDGWYLVGEEATVIGTPNEHYAFDSWELDGEVVSTDPSYTFEVNDE